MISVTPVAFSVLHQAPAIGAAVLKVCPTIKREWPNSGTDPFLQLSYDDLGIDSIEQLFAYANLALVNTPIGAPSDFDPIVEGANWIVYPLAGLRSSIAALAPDSIANVDAGLIAELLRCIDFAQANRLLLSIAW